MPYVHHAHDLGSVIDGEEDAIDVRLPSVT